MNGFQRRKVENFEKAFPGCLGRMGNLLDSSASIAGSRLLTDKPQREGLSISRSLSDVSRMSTPPFGYQIEDKTHVPELGRANKKRNGTPMKMLIAREMTKEVDGKCNPPNVVAKLMGLDTLPQQQPHSAAMRSHSKGFSRRSLSHSGIPSACWPQDRFQDKGMHCQVHPCPEENFKDVYEMLEQSEHTNYVSESSPQKGRHNENTGEKKMALIREKFMEAKRLSMDEKLRQSKEFQEALEVLSSNKDLLLKFLQEPNSMFSQHLYELHPLLPPSETKRITVLRPSKMMDNEKFLGSGKKSDQQLKKSPQVFQTASWDRDNSRCASSLTKQRADGHLAQPTRIVVLKPSPVKPYDTKAPVSPCMPPKTEDFYEEPENSELEDPIEVAKESSQHLHENLMGHRSNETLLSSVFSNKDIGDDSSFNKLDDEYGAGSLSDNEVISPNSRHSWDYIKRFDSPCSLSSFSRTSCSPESSVCREAKKRLSERWAMMASSSNGHDKHVRKSSSTLGEMLALCDTTNLVRFGEDSSDKPGVKGSTSSVTDNLNLEGSGDSPKNLPRSKSVPMSSTISDDKFGVEALIPKAVSHVPKSLTKSKSLKSSLKGKVSSIFFSRSKKSSKEKSVTVSKDESQCGTVETTGSPVSGQISIVTAQAINSTLEEDRSSCSQTSSSKPSQDLVGIGQKCGVISPESELDVVERVTSGNVSENQDQPSPISVLEPPFDDEDNVTPESQENTKADQEGTQVLLIQPLKSNLIDKSPPIGAIARSLSWGDSSADVTATCASEAASATEGLEDREDWFHLLQRLFSLTGLDGEVHSDTIFTRWHSYESPLEPSLRDKCANLDDNEPLHEAKRRRGRSNWKLVFDCANAALLEITGYGLERNLRSSPWDGTQSRLTECQSSVLVELVWGHMEGWFPDEPMCIPDYGGDINSLVVEKLVRKDVAGGGWTMQFRLERDILGNEIEEKLLEELVEETVGDLTDPLR